VALMSRVASNSDEAKARGEAARATIRKRFAASAVAADWGAAIDHVRLNQVEKCDADWLVCCLLNAAFDFANQNTLVSIDDCWPAA